ncbi:(2Fe-2S)-binding protein [Bacillus timonensis]|nr:(2Fe-2S)-binding protein [Bacillus timonensis]
MKKTIHVQVNHKNYEIVCHPAKTVLDVLREDLDFTASKECCGKGECGSCTILLNGEIVCSCLILAGQIEGKKIVTCEGIGTSSSMDAVQQAFVDEGATQCGYCTPGFIVAAHAFIRKVDHLPTEDEIKTALGGNLCRCTGYTKIIKAVEAAARKTLEKKSILNK